MVVVEEARGSAARNSGVTFNTRMGLKVYVTPSSSEPGGEVTDLTVAPPAAAGGATSMDTTLAATVQCSGRAWAVPALFSGVVLTLLTPFAVTLILTV